MQFVDGSVEDGVATVTLQRGKVNPINATVAEELRECFEELAGDSRVKVVILTGRGGFFSFGFDIPEFLGFSKESFTEFLMGFADLYTYVFLYPKPVVAALNGHTIAGGCMLATACDYRLMVSGKAKISLNEITFGSSVFAGSLEMLRACVGTRNAQTILYSGGMYSAEEALAMGWIDRITSGEELLEEAEEVARGFARYDGRAFESIKKLMRKPVIEEMRPREKDSILEFVEIWYSENTWKQLRQIKIHD